MLFYSNLTILNWLVHFVNLPNRHSFLNIIAVLSIWRTNINGFNEIRWFWIFLKFRNLFYFFQIVNLLLENNVFQSLPVVFHVHETFLLFVFFPYFFLFLLIRYNIITFIWIALIFELYFCFLWFPILLIPLRIASAVRLWIQVAFLNYSSTGLNPKLFLFEKP